MVLSLMYVDIDIDIVYYRKVVREVCITYRACFLDSKFSWSKKGRKYLDDRRTV